MNSLRLIILNCIIMFVSNGAMSQQPKNVYSMEDTEKFDISHGVVVMNYEYLHEIQRYKKLELGIELQDDIAKRIEQFVRPDYNSRINSLNPFLEWDIKITATFTDQNGNKKTRDAFFYQDYTTDERRNDWIEKPTEYPMRIRFAPSEIGTYTTEIAINYRDTNDVFVSEDLPAFEFTVVESNHLGYVSIHENRKNFQRGGEVILPMGHNLAGPYNGVDTYGGDPKTTHKRAQLDDWKNFKGDVKKYIDQGGKYIKLIQIPYSGLIEFEERGNYFNRLHYAWEQDEILDVCEEKDVLIHFNLMFQNPIMKFSQYGRTNFDFGHWNGLNEIDRKDPYKPYCYYTYEGKEPHEMFMDSLDLAYHKQRMRYYISRYGYSPQIYNFELLSEPWHLNETFYNPNYFKTGIKEGKWTAPSTEPNHPDFYKVKKALVNYHKEMSDYIKDELGHKEHLIGITIFSGGASYPFGDKDILLDSSVFLPNIDIIGVNRYDATPDKLIASKASDNNETPVGENSYFQMVKKLHDLCDKPVIYSEAGSDGSCDGVFMHKIDVMTLAFTGAASVQMWAGYSHGPGMFDERTLWQHTIRAQQHLDGKNFTRVLGAMDGEWVQGRQMDFIRGGTKKPGKEVQYYISQSGDQSVGYVRNRTINDVTIKTKECNVNYPSPWMEPQSIDPKKNGKLTIDGLMKGEYIIDWYGFENGNYLYSSNVKVGRGGKLKKLPHPEMAPATEGNPANPVVWFVVKPKV